MPVCVMCECVCPSVSLSPSLPSVSLCCVWAWYLCLNVTVTSYRLEGVYMVKDL